MNFGAVVYLPEEISSFWVFVGFSFSVMCWSECCVRDLMRITLVDTVNLLFSTKIVTFKYNVYRHKMSPAGEFKSKCSSLKWPHWSACCACLRVWGLPCCHQLLCLCCILCLFRPPSFVAASLCTYMSSCFSKTIEQSTLSHKQALFKPGFFAAVQPAMCDAGFGVSRETFK